MVDLANRYALQIVRWAKLDDLRPIEINFSLKEQIFCPADEVKLGVICTLFGNKGKQRLRIGACDKCGYIGYIDYPSQKWVDNFYLSEWLSVREKDIEAEVERRTNMSPAQIKEDREIRTVKLDRFLMRHKLDRNKVIFEIGCGYGQSLAYFKEKGYKVLGCESSLFRAKVAQRAYGLPVINAPFDDASFQRRLKLSQLSLIFSHHVLEHVSDPSSIMRLASSLQSKGGYLIIGVPNAYTEPSMMTIFYLPHRSAFTKQSLVNLFHKYAYELVDDFSDQEELYLVGRRTSRTIKIDANTKHYHSRSLQKFTRVLGFGRMYLTLFRRMWCYRRLGFDHGGQVMHFEFAQRILGELYLIIFHKLLMLYLYWRNHHLEVYIACIVKNVSFRYTNYSQSPIEIQFKGNIKLLTK